MEILHHLETYYFHSRRLVPDPRIVQFYTMLGPAEIFALVEERRKELGLSQAEVSLRAFGKSDNTAIQSLKKGSSPSIDRVAAMAKVLGLECYFGPVRDHGPQPPDADPEGLAIIPLHDAFLAAGSGIENGTEQIADYLAFKKEWLRKIGLSPSNAVLARAKGDSMQPVIWDGDMLLIDRSKIEPPPTAKIDRANRHAPVYALLDDGHAKVKRVQIMDQEVAILISDNPDYPPIFVKTKNLTIIGKVMWWGHTTKE